MRSSSGFETTSAELVPVTGRPAQTGDTLVLDLVGNGE